MKAPLIYLGMDIIYAIFEIAGGLVILNLYKEEYEFEYQAADGSIQTFTVA